MFVLLSVFYVCKYLSIICILCLYYYLYFMFYYLYFMFVLLSVFYVSIICILCLYYYLYFMFVSTFLLSVFYVCTYIFYTYTYTVMLRLANIGAGYFGLKSILAKIAFSFFLWTFNFFQLSQKHRFWLISLDLTEGFVSNFGHKSL